MSADDKNGRLVKEFIEGDEPVVDGQRERRGPRAEPAAAARR